jgi:hypothetical protein
VFTTRLGTAMDAANVRRDFRRALALVPGLKPEEWTPRELRHSFVSLLSDAGVPIEDVSRLVVTAAPASRNSSTGIRSVRSSRAARRSWIGSSVRQPAVALPRLSPPTIGSSPRAKPHELDSVSATLVIQLVTQALLINTSVTIEMSSDKAEQWSG